MWSLWRFGVKSLMCAGTTFTLWLLNQLTLGVLSLYCIPRLLRPYCGRTVTFAIAIFL